MCVPCPHCCPQQLPVSLASTPSPSTAHNKSACPPQNAWLSKEPQKNEGAPGTPSLTQAASDHYVHPELRSSGEPVPGDDDLRFFLWSILQGGKQTLTSLWLLHDGPECLSPWFCQSHSTIFPGIEALTFLKAPEQNETIQTAY